MTPLSVQGIHIDYFNFHYAWIGGAEVHFCFLMPFMIYCFRRKLIIANFRS